MPQHYHLLLARPLAGCGPVTGLWLHRSACWLYQALALQWRLSLAHGQNCWQGEGLGGKHARGVCAGWGEGSHEHRGPKLAPAANGTSAQHLATGVFVAQDTQPPVKNSWCGECLGDGVTCGQDVTTGYSGLCSVKEDEQKATVRK